MNRKLKCTNPATTTYGSSCIDYKCTLHETCPLLKKFNLDIKNSKELTINNHTFTLDKNADEHQVKQYFLAIEKLSNECHNINNEIKDLQETLDHKKQLLATSFQDLHIKKFDGPMLLVSGYETQRFKGWTDEEALTQSIPIYYRDLQTLSPNHKKIKSLIKKHKLPIELLKFKEKSEPKFTLRFQNQEE